MGKSASIVAGATLSGSLIQLANSHHMIWSVLALVSAFFLGWYFSGKLRAYRQSETRYYANTSSV